MARTEARLKCSIWDDGDYRSLTLEAQWLYEAILSQKDLSLCGVLTWTPKRFSKLASNASPRTVSRGLEELRERRYVVLDDDTDELWVRTFIVNDRVLDNPNSVIGMSHDFGAIHSQPIRDGLVDGLGDGFLDGLPQRFKNGLPKGFHDRLAKPFVDAIALACARPPPPAPVPPASSLQPPASVTDEHRSSSKLSRAADPPAEEDGRVAQAVSVVAQRRLAQRLAADVVERYGPVTDRDQWLQQTADRLRANHGAHLAELAATDASVEVMVSAIEPMSASPAGHSDAAAPRWPEFEWELDEDGFAVERRVSA